MRKQLLPKNLKLPLGRGSFTGTPILVRKEKSNKLKLVVNLIYEFVGSNPALRSKYLKSDIWSAGAEWIGAPCERRDSF
jgi:hypothetical protein